MVLPGILVALLGGLYYLLPRGSGERTSYLASILLTEIMFLVMVTQVVPLAKEIPNVGQMFLNQTVLLSVVMIFVLFIDKIHFTLTRDLEDSLNKSNEEDEEETQAFIKPETSVKSINFASVS